MDKEGDAMINFNQPETYEHIDFNHLDFPFGCYHIKDSTTLPHWHTHTEIIYAKKGSVNLYINGTPFLCAEGDIQFIPGNSLHTIIPKGHGTYVAIVIGDELMNDMNTDIHLSQILTPISKANQLSTLHIATTDTFYPNLFSSIQTILSENEKEDSYYEPLIKIELCKFYTQLLRSVPHLHITKKEHTFTQTQNFKQSIEYLTQHYSNKLTIKTMSHLMNMSEQHFSRLFKAYTGKTFVDYLTLFRLEQAKKLLIHSDIPITQIPELTGFCNPNYFSRIFKTHYGQTPSQTRKESS